MKLMRTGQVHRFRDAVAAYVGNGETVYMTPKEARSMARALISVARSVERESFVDSSGNTTPLIFAGDSGLSYVRRADGRAIMGRHMVRP